MMSPTQVRLVRQIENNRTLQEQVFLEAYESVVKLSCPVLPRNCQIEIMRMLSSFKINRTQINRQPIDPSIPESDIII